MPDGMSNGYKARFIALINSTRDLLWETNAAGLFTYLSPGVEQISGYTFGELIGHSPVEFMIERDQARCAAIIGDSIRRAAPFDLLACTLRRKDGILVDAEVNGTPLLAENGEVAGCCGITRDVTSRNRLLADQRHLAQLVESASDAIMSKDLNHIVTSWNKGAERVFGYTAAEAVGQHVSFMAPADRSKESIALSAKMLAGGSVENHRTVRRHKDGHAVEILITYSPIRDIEGVIIGISGIAKDISAEVRLERSLAAQTALLEAQRELSPDGILVVNADREIISCNRQFLKIWGIPLDTRMDRDDEKALEGGRRVVAEPENFIDRVEKLYANRHENGFDELAMKDGRVLQRYTAPMNEPDGAYLGRLWFFRDVTAQRKAEQQARTELERFGRSMLQTVSALASTAELRDPYTSGHQRRVSDMAVALARKIHVPAAEVEGIRIAAVLHDIGKISIPAEILNKPGRLSDAEFEIIKAHPGAGYEILKDIEFPWPVADMVRQHHERLDGGGYPQGLRGEQIIRGARILTVADVFESMSSHRPYRPSLGPGPAIAELKAGRGTRYDAEIVDACIALFGDQETKYAASGDDQSQLTFR